ncbi:two-component regulator propeller domain-containing protein [Chitinophaga pinensis]|uniref:ligand-binding sensor domain-containing protein n=1 Tax=Chitinophaga pinensis TaxID=79329 RepID=UPI0021BD0936|nr:two-component regulator propeller domain-containing protein [Chitinophaga pinensis]
MMLWLCLAMNSLFAAGEPLRSLSIENGLSNNAVLNVYQDSKGFMWIGTYDGLNRYDGYKFKIYRNRIGDSTSLIDNGIYTIDGDTEHRLWIGGRKGISVFNPVNEHFSAATFANGKPVQGNIHIIKAGNDGLVLVGSENNGLLQFNRLPGTGKQIPLENNTSYEVTAIDFTPDKSAAYVFVQHVGLCRYDCRTAKMTVISRILTQANCLKSDIKGMLWLGTDQGLFSYNNGTFSTNYLEENSKIVNLCADQQGAIWAGSDGHGIYIAKDGKAEHSGQALNSNAVYSICEDREGRKWIGT